MVKHICDKCETIFKTKSSYTRHVNRKNPCDQQFGKVNDNNNVCDTCNKKFNSYDSLYKHAKRKVCSKSRVTVNNTQNINIDKQLNVDKMNVDGDVKVVKFGNEDISYISDDIYQSILGKGYKSVEEFVDHTHFNPDHPENHNIYIADIKNNYVLIYDGLQWNIKDRDEAIEDMIYAKSDYLSVKFEELMHKLSPMDIKKFTNFMKNRDNDIKMKMVKTDLKLMLYNNRYIPCALRKQLEDSMRNQKTIKYKKSKNKDKNLDNILSAIAEGDLTAEKIKQIEGILNNNIK